MMTRAQCVSRALLGLVATTIACGALPAPAPAATQTWDFGVALDGKDIGFHRFTLRSEGPRSDLSTEARFAVKVLGFTAYQYAHDARERWDGGCIVALDAHTNDNGQRSTVIAMRESTRTTVTGSDAGRQVLGGCIKTFAYWNPMILREVRLLNAQTGSYEAVRIERIGEEFITVRRRETLTTHYRIAGAKHPIDLWYAHDDAWVALESTVDGGRQLSYRLR